MITMHVFVLLVGVLVLISLVAGLYSSRIGFSHLVVFLVVGMLAGVDGPLGLRFDDHAISFAFGNVALALILLDGGLRTSASTLRAGIRPASLLATVGVVVTALLTAVAAFAVLDINWKSALLVGAIVASTDAAAVFNQLQYGRIRLGDRLVATLEVESGMNDPVAVFMVLACIAWIQQPDLGVTDLLSLLLAQAGAGLLVALLAGWAAVLVLPRLPLEHDHQGLTALLLAAAGMVVFATAGLVGGSGFLAIYVFGLIVVRRAPGPVEQSLAALNGYTWLAQASMFLLLGLLVTPHEVMRFALPALAIAAALTLVARPLAIVVCLAPLRYSLPEQLFVAWGGLRGAVPIVLALFPVIEGLPNAFIFFDVAFVVVLTSLLLQAPTLGWAARRLGLTRSS